MGNWIPGDPTLVAQILKISAEYTAPPPEGFVSPVSWGVVDNFNKRFAAAGISRDAISCAPTIYTFRSTNPPAALLDTFRRYYGPTMNAFDAAERDGRAGDLYDRLAALFDAQNEGGTGETVISANFLKVVVVK